MLEVNSSNIKIFQNYMVFFEHAKYLKSIGIINRGLVAPEFGNEDSILKRVSSVLLKGLRAEECLDIKNELVNNIQSVKLVSINRLRRRSSSSDFNFIFNYDYKRFIDSESFDASQVKTITSSEHKKRFAQSIFGDITTPNVVALLRDYEFVFSPVPNWWEVENHTNNIVINSKDLVNQGLRGENIDTGYRIMTNSINVEIASSIKHPPFNWHTYKTYGENTFLSLHRRYALGENARIPSIGTPENFRPVVNDAQVKAILENGHNVHMCSMQGAFYGFQSNSSLFLIKRLQDDEGPFLAPNLIEGNIKFQYKGSKELINDPQAFYKSAYDFNKKIKQDIVGITE